MVKFPCETATVEEDVYPINTYTVNVERVFECILVVAIIAGFCYVFRCRRSKDRPWFIVTIWCLILLDAFLTVL